MHLDAKPNDYQQSLGQFFDKTPKAVFAALAVSFVHRLAGEEHSRTPAAIEAALREEWRILFENGLVPQRPPRQLQLGQKEGRS